MKSTDGRFEMFEDEQERMRYVIEGVEKSIELYERRDLIVPKRLLRARNTYVSILQQLVNEQDDKDAKI